MSEKNLFLLLGLLALLLFSGGLALLYLELPVTAPTGSHTEASAKNAALDCEAAPDSSACLARESLELIRAIEHPATRTRLLAKAAVAARRDARTEGASEFSDALFVEAEQSARAIESDGMRLMASLPVAYDMTRAGHPRGPDYFAELVDRFERTAQPRQPGPDEPPVLGGPAEWLTRLAQAQATAGDIDGAWNTAMAQKTESARIKTFADVATGLTTHGDPAHAPRFAREAHRRYQDSQDETTQIEAIVEVAGALARAGLLTEALALAAAPDDMMKRTFSHMHIVGALADSGRIEEAEEIFKRIENFQGRGQALWWIMQAKARAGDLAGAGEVLARIHNPVLRDQAAADLAAAEAPTDLPRALDRIADLPPEFHRSRGLRVVVESLIDAGKLADAEEVLAGLGDDALRRGLIVRMVAARVKFGDARGALDMARGAEDPQTRAEALLTVAIGKEGLD